MPCKDFLPLVEKLADGEATAADKRKAEAHLRSCRDCQEHFRFLEALPGAARQATPEGPPEIYWEALPGKIMERIARMEKREKPTPRRWFSGFLSPSGLRWAGALAAAVVAAVIGLQVLEAPFSSQPPTRDSLRAPAESSLSEEVQGGKEKQTSDRAGESFQSSQADQLERADPSPTPGERARQSELGNSTESGLAPPPAAPMPMDESRETLLRDEPSTDDRDQAFQKARASDAAGLRELDESDESGEPRPEEAATLEGGGRFEAGVQRQGAGGEPSSEADEAVEGGRAAPVGARPLRTQPEREPAERRIHAGALALEGRSADENYRALLERYPLESSTPADGAGQRPASPAVPADKARECSDWRQFVERHASSEHGTSARYRLALCSIALFDSSPSEDNRSQAMDDGRSYLEADPGGERAEAIRRALERIER